MSERKEVNLEEILKNKINSIDFGSNPKQLNKMEIIDCMQEACNQAIDLATENARTKEVKTMVALATFSKRVSINRESILNTKNQIKR